MNPTSKLLIDEFLENNVKSDCLNFFRQNPHGYLILLFLHYYQVKGEELTLVNLYDLIPSKIASNLTILNTITQASEMGFIEKIIIESDKRSNSIKLKEKYFKEIDRWLDSISNIQ